MPRPHPLVTLLSGAALMALSLSGCSRTNDSPAANDAAQSAQDWSTLKDFDAIDATGPDDVVLTIGNGFSVKAEGDAKAIANLDIRVKGDTLVIGRNGKMDWNWGDDGGKSVTIRVTMPAIKAADLTGSGNLDIDRAVGDSLDLSLTGVGDVLIGTATLKSLSADITGTGSIKIAGTADRAKLSVTGVGDIDGDALKVGTADLSVLGTGDIDIASDGKVAISITGPGDVTVKGKAQCTTSGTGPGEARCAP